MGACANHGLDFFLSLFHAHLPLIRSNKIQQDLSQIYIPTCAGYICHVATAVACYGLSQVLSATHIKSSHLAPISDHAFSPVVLAKRSMLYLANKSDHMSKETQGDMRQNQWFNTTCEYMCLSRQPTHCGSKTQRMLTKSRIPVFL